MTRTKKTYQDYEKEIQEIIEKNKELQNIIDESNLLIGNLNVDQIKIKGEIDEKVKKKELLTKSIDEEIKALRKLSRDKTRQTNSERRKVRNKTSEMAGNTSKIIYREKIIERLKGEALKKMDIPKKNTIFEKGPNYLNELVNLPLIEEEDEE